MYLERILKLLTVLQLITLSQNSHVQPARLRIRAEARDISGPHSGFEHWPLPRKHHHHHHHHQHQQRQQRHQQQERKHHWQHAGQRVHRQRDRWSGRRKSFERQHFTAWTAWSGCGADCVQRRERYCKVKRKCGHTKQLEERKCWRCLAAPVAQVATPSHAGLVRHALQVRGSNSPAVMVNRAHHQSETQQLLAEHRAVMHQMRLPVLQEIISERQNAAAAASHDDDDDDDDDDFFTVNTKPKFKKKRKPIYIDVDDYEDLEADEVEDELDKLDQSASASSRPPKQLSGPVRSIHSRRHPRRGPAPIKGTPRNLADGDDGIEGDVFLYEDFDVEPDPAREGDHYADAYEDATYGDFQNASWVKERATPDSSVPKHRRIYSKWSRWTKCSPKCTTRRYKKCRIREQCGREVLREIAYCYTEGSFCQQWLQAQVQKAPPYEVQPVAAARRRGFNAGDDPESNAIVSDFIMSGKGYRGPEYSPLKLKCGTATIRAHKRNAYNMLKIIGGKAARKGEWPWQVAIFNRFKEAFCGGTLIAPQWVLTAAHCVRKVLYVRLGEHNLDYEDGTELQLRVLKSFKHPNFDKKTVDSDVALLRLPKSANISTWIGFSCLPRPYQPLPKNIDCTVIGWGKRRNRDVAGTSVLHQAEVPIIPMDNCRSVYHDYTITKNMFCAGHRRGRIDTCAGDSGGPLLCRDTTKPNHPWTIFGITSFGDGCAKRNKFGIYAKVPNYVDWVWSVINCNGNCKLHQRGYATN